MVWMTERQGGVTYEIALDGAQVGLQDNSSIPAKTQFETEQWRPPDSPRDNYLSSLEYRLRQTAKSCSYSTTCLFPARFLQVV